MSKRDRDLVRRLLDAGGTTYAEEAGIGLRDELASLVPGGHCAPLAAALTRARHGLPDLEES